MVSGLTETQTNDGIQLPQFGPENIVEWALDFEWALRGRDEAHEGLMDQPNSSNEEAPTIKNRKKKNNYCLAAIKQVVEANADAKIFADNYYMSKVGAEPPVEPLSKSRNNDDDGDSNNQDD
jgi:hypothetical protein